MSDFTGPAVAGRVATPADADWDQARAAWNLAANQEPQAVVFAESGDDVAATVRHAAEQGLRVSAQGTGHGAVATGSLEGAVLIKTEKMKGIDIDPEAQTARVEAGVWVLELSEAAQKHGLCGMPGSAPDVGVIGYTLGGGLSWLGRQHGWACNRVDAIEVVTAAGEQLTVDADNDPDLFWALRGGGGGYGIVTALHLRLLPIADIYAGALVFPAEVGADAVKAYRDWAESVGEEVTSIVRFVTPPPLPDVPEPIRGVPLLTIDAACIGSQEQGEATIAPLREIGEPIMDTFGQIPVEGLCRIHMDPEAPVPGLGHHQVLSGFPDEAIDVFVAQAGVDSGSPLLLTEVRQVGGALGRTDPDGGALSKLDAGWVMFGIGLPMSPELGEAIEAQHDRNHEAFAPWAADGGYFNFAERPCDTDAILPPEVCARLREVKDRYDPDGVLMGNHELAVAEA